MNRDTITKIFKNLITIRNVEIKIIEEYKNQKMRCPVHLSIGQEAISSSLDIIFNKKDKVVSSHRAHAHYIGKGGNLIKFFGELLGLDGCSGGVGGSMHLNDKNVGFIGSTAIVGNTIPVGVGLSFADKINNKNNTTIIFFGEGATEQGVFYESINFAALKKTPTIFVCENNLYSVYTPLKYRQPKERHLINFSKSFGLKTFKTDGNNPLKVYETFKLAKNFIRKNNKPVFIQFNTYRYIEHCGVNQDDHLNYRPSKEINFWKKKCPIKFIKKYCIDKKILTKEETLKIERQITKNIDNKFELATKLKKPNFDKIQKNFYK